MLLLGACGETAPLPAIDLRLDIEVSSQAVALGEGFDVTVTHTWSRALDPAPWDEAQLSPLEVELLETTRREDERRIQETRHYRAYIFTAKDILIPAAVFPARTKSEGRIRVVRSRPIRMRVRREVDPKDPGRPEAPGAPLSEPTSRLPYLLGLAALLASGLFLWQRRRTPSLYEVGESEIVAPRVSIGLAERISRLRDTGLEPGATLVALAELLREDVGVRHGVEVASRTSVELVRIAAAPDLGALLTPCDEVKFAAAKPGDAARDALLERAISYAQQQPEERA